MKQNLQRKRFDLFLSGDMKRFLFVLGCSFLYTAVHSVSITYSTTDVFFFSECSKNIGIHAFQQTHFILIQTVDFCVSKKTPFTGGLLIQILLDSILRAVTVDR